MLHNVSLNSSRIFPNHNRSSDSASLRPSPMKLDMLKSPGSGILRIWIRISLFGLHHSNFLLQLWKYNVSQAVNELGCQTEVTTDHMWLSSLGWQSGLTWLTLPGQKKQSNYHLLTEAANMEPRYDWHCDWGVESGDWTREMTWPGLFTNQRIMQEHDLQHMLCVCSASV